MQQFIDALKNYWGYDDFRPLQSEIIRSIASGKDTLGLMPTGGGKSLTFQVPTMVMKGLCIVVTPLIALMKDQVENLRSKGILAASIYSGMSPDEILLTLENAVLDAYKFLYVSPERLYTDIFKNKVQQMEVCMIAVDEAHCISQWGYDFRPAYLQIAGIRALLPKVPILALTATATPEVVDDIQLQLKFETPNVFKKSFHRFNLAYVVRTVENKTDTLLKILHNVQGTSVVYVRNRKKTKEIADFLNTNGISAEHFHAGLKNDTKDERQHRWKRGDTRVIVSTNAFGMGIDKPDVRTVIHIDLPDSLEAYFQEAGRAGRDEQKAYAVLLYNNSDTTKIKKRITDNFPQKEQILRVYDSLCNYLQIAIGKGLDMVFPFDIGDFCLNFKLPILTTHSCLKILQQAGYIELTDEQESTSSVLFTTNKEDLYHIYHDENQEKLIHILLRMYTGLFTDEAYINEDLIAKRLNWKRDEVYNILIQLSKENIIKYIPRKKSPFVTFIREREDTKYIHLTKEVYEERLDRYEKRVSSVLEYAQATNICRSKILLSYFGETDSKPCGKCDICLRKIETEIKSDDFKALQTQIIQALKENPENISALVKKINAKEAKSLNVIRFLIDNGYIVENNQKKLELSKFKDK